MRRRLPALLAAALASCSLTSADADWSSRVRLETAGYADSDHVSVVSPSMNGAVTNPARGLRVSGSYLADVVSAASVDIVSTASRRWRETRHAGTLDLKYKPHDLGVTASSYLSVEPDYRSLGVGGSLIQDFAERAHTFTLGYSFAQDVSGRADAPFSTFSRVINKHTFSPGLTFTVDRSTVVSLMLDVMIERGDSSKPYRYVPFFDSPNRVPAGASIDLVNRVRLPERALERLPTRRDRFALSARLLHRWEKVTLRLNERLYTDNWGLLSSTTDLRLPIDVTDAFRVFPHGRVHLQSGASFWQHAYTLVDGTYPSHWAGDRELGPLRTYTFGGGAQLTLGRYLLTGQVDGLVTNFLDALYIKRRTGIFGAIGVEAEFE